MRVEGKVYMDDKEMYRIQQAANKLGMSMSGYLRWAALKAAAESGIPEYRSLLEGQGTFPEFVPVEGK